MGYGGCFAATVVLTMLKKSQRQNGFLLIMLMTFLLIMSFLLTNTFELVILQNKVTAQVMQRDLLEQKILALMWPMKANINPTATLPASLQIKRQEEILAIDSCAICVDSTTPGVIFYRVTLFAKDVVHDIVLKYQWVVARPSDHGHAGTPAQRMRRVRCGMQSIFLPGT